MDKFERKRFLYPSFQIFFVADQAALHGALAKIRDLGLAIFLVERIDCEGESDAVGHQGFQSCRPDICHLAARSWHRPSTDPHGSRDRGPPRAAAPRLCGRDLRLRRLLGSVAQLVRQVVMRIRLVDLQPHRKKIP